MFLKICFLSYIINSAIAQCELLITFTKSFNFFINSRNHIKKKDGENFNSCADSCSNEFEYKYSLSLDTGISELKDNQLIEILDEDFEKQNCSKNGNYLKDFSIKVNNIF